MEKEEDIKKAEEDCCDINPTSTGDQNEETDELLSGHSKTNEEASARGVMFGSLVSVACAFSLPFAGFVAGVGFWVDQYSKETWVKYHWMQSYLI